MPHQCHPDKLKEGGKILRSLTHQVFNHACEKHIRDGLIKINQPLSEESRKAILDAYTAGLSDPFGDGDQSPVPGNGLRGLAAAEASQPLRTAWSSGMDVQEALSNEESWFHYLCFLGAAGQVAIAVETAKRLQEDGTDDKALLHLLEGRVCLLRLTPLHYACQGARIGLEVNVNNGKSDHAAVAEILLQAGARADPKDICGYTPLSNAAGFLSHPASLCIVPMLHRFGANPNMKTRFGEGILMQTVMANNVDAFKALLKIGADVMLGDNDGLNARTMAQYSPPFLQAVTECQRERLIKKMSCDFCQKPSATKYCVACKKVYYCSKECQKSGWKQGHKQTCGRHQSEEEYLDIVVDTMTCYSLFPGQKMPFVQFTNSITGATSRTRMKPIEFEKAFVVKVNKPFMADGRFESTEGPVKLNVKNSDFLLIKKEDEGARPHARLIALFDNQSLDTGKIYLSAKWLVPTEKTSKGKDRNVLRLDVSKLLPPPKNLW